MTDVMGLLSAIKDGESRRMEQGLWRLVTYLFVQDRENRMWSVAGMQITDTALRNLIRDIAESKDD